MPDRRTLLPLLPAGDAGRRHGNRSHLTCLYRCGNACDSAVPNRSDNPYFGDVVAATIARRSVLRAVGVGAAVVGVAPLLSAGSAAAADASPDTAGAGRTKDRLTFRAIEPTTQDELIVPERYDYRVVARWGDPVLPGAPAFDPHAQTPEAQAAQFGYNCDYTTTLPWPGDDDRALLVVNHEYTDEQLMFPGVASIDATTLEQRRIAMMAHGISVVAITRIGRSGSWRLAADRRYNQRLTAESPFKLSGPAAGSPLLRTAADPTGRYVRGTLNDCAGGTTPWGTTLHGEENFDQYFGLSGTATPELATAYARYGLPTATTASERGWEEVDERFDLSKHPHEANRFGWVVEVDPYEKTWTPRKRTALGRFKHEGATIALAEDGRVVAYMGDDERFDYIYKFVSAKRFRPGRGKAARAHNKTLLDEGDLFVARFTGDSPPAEIDGSGDLPSDGAFDGMGAWIPLVQGGRSEVPGMSVDEVLVHTRLAADLVGATKMDRPEDIERNPVNGRVYAALTNNSKRTSGADEANPLTRSVTADGEQAGNRNGHILEWRERGGDAAARRFSWRIFLVAGDPDAPETYFAGFDKSKVSPISCPDNVAFDPDGNLWISTDGNQLGANDGFYAVPVTGGRRGYVRQFASVPYGAEASGPWITPDGASLFVAVQHPGETDGSTFDAPSSTWPDRLSSGAYPRPSVAVIYKTTGSRRIGS